MPESHGGDSLSALGTQAPRLWPCSETQALYVGASVFTAAKRSYFFLSPGGNENSELNEGLALYNH